VTVAGATHSLPSPYFVLATQNPIEQEGTYPLPEAQLDRFMVELRIGYPTRAEEEAIVSATTGGAPSPITPVLGAAELLEMQKLVRRLPAPPTLVSQAVKLARATRPGTEDATKDVNTYVRWGAGPRASQYLVLGAKARAALAGRAVPDLDDLRDVATSVLRHRMVLNFQGEAEGITLESVLAPLIQGVR
jgi:MoxR-like ATPase